MKPLAWLAWLGLPFKGLYLHELVKEIWSDGGLQSRVRQAHPRPEMHVVSWYFYLPSIISTGLDWTGWIGWFALLDIDASGTYI